MSKKANKTRLPSTLILGLGGTGCKIVSKVEQLATPEQRKYIRFVHLDTDANELRAIKMKSPGSFIIQTSTRITVGQALRSDVEAREKSFPLNRQLLNKPLTEGAGQVRAISKLAFDSCLREGRLAPLHDAINELQKLNGDDMAQSMRVVIVSTLVGGTGSGILLPLSMYLRNYLENVCRKKPIIRGFCLLPDVFFHSADKTDIEKNNLRTNAYAALRELDAFMLKADSTKSAELGEKFWLKMPTPGTVGEYDDYTVDPMDFCFLFDGQNMDGDGLDNLQMYIEHAANCIYASSVSKLNKRLNSSEDNTILQRCAENGRNRYCGIGTSKVVYPFEAVRNYIAMKWMSQAMTEDWLRYDKAYQNKLISIQQSKARGVMLPPVEKRKFYCDSVASDQGETNYFAFSIFEACHNKDKMGISFTTPRWKTYYDKLKAFIENKVAEDVGYDEGLAQSIEESIGNLRYALDGNKVSDFTASYYPLATSMKAFFQMTKRHAEDIAGVAADSLFSPHNFNTGSEHHVEHWLTENGVPLHPNAIRYFLYNLEELLKEEKRRLETPADEASDAVAGEGESLEDAFAVSSFADLEKSIKGFFEDKNYSLDTKSGEAVSVNIGSYVMSLKGGFAGVTQQGRNRDVMERVINDCNDYVSNVSDYYATYLRLAIIQKALDYVNQLCNSYEYFYQQLETEISRLPRRMERIEESYSNDAGNPIMYACASSACLKGLSDRCPNMVGSIELTESFKKELFDDIFKTLSVSEPEKQRAFIDDLVSNKILDFWRGEVVSQYGKQVDMDIIDAMRTQAELEENKFGAEEQLYYIEDICAMARKLSAPFIDKPIGQEPYIIKACSLGEEVLNTEDVLKSGLIREVFHGCECDELMGKYQIMFMSAMYDLKIEDLPKFAPVDDLYVDPHGKGSYYKAYWDRIDGVLPDSNKTRIITPHLDKRWHYIGVMPDLSEKSENKCIAEAQIAFFISLMYRYVRFDRDQYRFIDEAGDFISDDIVVEDGRCNRLSEIYQAMLMSRPLVSTMNKHYSDELKKEKDGLTLGNRDYKSTKLYRGVKDAHFKAYDQIPNVSVFEIPILCKMSSGSTTYSDAEYGTMLKNILEFMEDYLEEFYSNPSIRQAFLVEWLCEQAKLMISNLKEYYDVPEKAIMIKPFGDPLVNRIANIIINRIRSYELCEDAVAVADALEDEWKSLTE